jgi:hypothetical protein
VVQGDEVEFTVIKRLFQKHLYGFRLLKKQVVITGDHPDVSYTLPPHPFPYGFKRIRIDIEKAPSTPESGFQYSELRFAARSDG